MACVAALVAAAVALAAEPTPSADDLDRVVPGDLATGEFRWDPERSPSGPVLVVVSIPDQFVTVYRNGIRIGASAVSTGKPGHSTPSGVFTLLDQAVENESGLHRDWQVPQRDRFTWDGVALHADALPGYPATRGCVRLPLEFSRLLYALTSTGGTVAMVHAAADPEESMQAGALLARDAKAASAAGRSNVAAVAASADRWTPEASPTGPLSILLSVADRRLYVYRNGVSIGEARVTVDGTEPFGDRAYTMLEGWPDRPDRSLAGEELPRWTELNLSPGVNDEGVDLPGRVHLSAGFASKVFDALTPGATLFVTDAAATGQTRTDRGFTVIASAAGPLADSAAILAAAPDLDPGLLAEALGAIRCAQDGAPAREDVESILALIDFSLPSTERRLWVLDLARPALLFAEHVAHGVGSGENMATQFSNVDGSLASSLGLYRAAEVYRGRHGESLRLDGLTPGFNDRARARDIVIHSADYVSEAFVREHGQLGQSWGCPALAEAVAQPIIETLRDGAWVYISARTPEWTEYLAAQARCGWGPASVASDAR